MKKLVIIAALMVAIFMVGNSSVFAEEATTEETTAPIETTTQSETLRYPVQVYDLSQGGKELVQYSRVYELKSLFGAKAVVELHIKEVLKGRNYVVGKTVIGQQFVELEPTGAKIYVHPSTKRLQVVHKLFNCKGELELALLEETDMPYTMDLTEETAKELLKSQVQKVSGRGYDYKAIEVKPYEYLPYKVYDMVGKEITPEQGIDTIYIYYKDKACEDQDKADKVVTTEPKTDKNEPEVEIEIINQEMNRLPATGDNSVAFIVLAIVLLGLGFSLYKY